MRILQRSIPTFEATESVSIDQLEECTWIKADSLEDAFSKSQNEDSAWAQKNQRSTSVGDIIQDDEGNFHQVHGIGFEPVTLEMKDNQKALFDHIQRINNKELERSGDRCALLLVEHPHHWNKSNVHTVEDFRRNMAISEISDTYKYINGIRPRFIKFDSMSLEELESEADSIRKQLRKMWLQEKENLRKEKEPLEKEETPLVTSLADFL